MLKKIRVLLVALFLLCTFQATGIVHAENTGTIVLNNAVVKEEYHLYKVFDLTYSSDKSSTAHTYTKTVENDQFLNALLEEGSPFKADHVNGTDIYNITQKEGTLNTDLALFLESNITYLDEYTGAVVSGLDNEKKATKTTVQWSGLSYGYYYVTSTAGSFVTIDSTTPTVTIADKNSVPTLTAVQKSRSNPEYTTDTIGCMISYPVDYRFEITIGKGNNKEITLTSVLNHLTYIPDTISIKAVDKDNNDRGLTVSEGSYSFTTDDEVTSTLTLTLPAEFVQSLDENDKVIITVQANLNAYAVAANDHDNSNTVTMLYSNQEDERSLCVTCYNVDIVKVCKDAEGKPYMLDGAVFKLYDSESGGEAYKFRKYSPYVLPAADGTEELTGGHIQLQGIGKGTYWLEEVKAPDGYQRLTGRMEIVVNGDNKAAVHEDNIVDNGIQVVNSKTPVLANTGSHTFMIYLSVIGVITVIGISMVVFGSKKS